MSTEIKPQRNAPCPCGSGKKYKRCCGVLDPLPASSARSIPREILEAIRKKSTALREFEKKHGKVRPLIHSTLHNTKFVAVGKELHYAKATKWRVFPDFLSDHLRGVLSVDWGQAELAKPLEERHQILKWYDGLCRYQAKQSRDADGIARGQAGGAMMAWFRLAYDFYLIRHNE